LLVIWVGHYVVNMGPTHISFIRSLCKHRQSATRCTNLSS